MASANCAINKHVKFSGPAGEVFDSFVDLANQSLNNYWPNWKDYDNPRGYITPPIFTFQNAEINDQWLQNCKKEYVQKKEDAKDMPMPAVLNERIGDDGEYIVYSALKE